MATDYILFEEEHGTIEFDGSFTPNYNADDFQAVLVVDGKRRGYFSKYEAAKEERRLSKLDAAGYDVAMTVVEKRGR